MEHENQMNLNRRKIIRYDFKRTTYEPMGWSDIFFTAAVQLNGILIITSNSDHFQQICVLKVLNLINYQIFIFIFIFIKTLN